MAPWAAPKTADLAKRQNFTGVGNNSLPFDPVIYPLVAGFIGVALYMAFVIIWQTFTCFKKRQGLYFWSLLISSCGIIGHELGNILKVYPTNCSWVFYTILIMGGWMAMVTGQSFVLWSRLHLVVQKAWILRAVLIVIVADAFFFHVPFAVMYFGTNSEDPRPWVYRFAIMERIQIVAFSLQETLISALYIWATFKVLKPSYTIRTRTVMRHLIYVNVLAILLDVCLLCLILTSNYIIKSAVQPVVYGLKLQFEFLVLNQLMAIAKRGLTSSQQNSSRSKELGPPNFSSLDGLYPYKEKVPAGGLSDLNKQSTTNSSSSPNPDRNERSNCLMGTTYVANPPPVAPHERPADPTLAPPAGLNFAKPGAIHHRAPGFPPSDDALRHKTSEASADSAAPVMGATQPIRRYDVGDNDDWWDNENVSGDGGWGLHSFENRGKHTIRPPWFER
ncbi:MAG: hypothetical protein M1833_004863 [Piccolia ochrophora]|nr:MAG: hypothetical protein M1833_004863 [Piccolia ochrophora]